ncbi:hypothetical protein [Actinoallomurus sp. CA-142502]
MLGTHGADVSGQSDTGGPEADHSGFTGSRFDRPEGIVGGNTAGGG